MSETKKVIESDSTDQTPPEPEEVQIRKKDGKFGPKITVEKPQITTPEPPTPTSPQESDELLDEIEADFWKALKGKVEVKELEGFDQRTRIKMLRMLSNTNIIKKSKEAVDPTTAPPPTPEVHIPTLMERNSADKFKADIRNKTSYIDVANKLRGKK